MLVSAIMTQDVAWSSRSTMSAMKIVEQLSVNYKVMDPWQLSSLYKVESMHLLFSHWYLFIQIRICECGFKKIIVPILYSNKSILNMGSLLTKLNLKNSSILSQIGQNIVILMLVQLCLMSHWFGCFSVILWVK